MGVLWIAVLLLGTPYGVALEGVAAAGEGHPDESGTVDKTAGWVREATSSRPEVAKAARRSLKGIDLEDIPHLEVYLRDISVRIVIAESIEAACDRAISTLARSGEEAISEAEREALLSDFDQVGPAAASSLSRAILYDRGDRHEAAKELWKRLEDAPPVDEEGWGRLRRTIPLSAPILEALAGKEDPPGRAAALLREAAEREVSRLGDADYRAREAAVEVLLRVGETAREVLRERAASGDPHLAHAAGRILPQIRWRISPTLVRRIGGRLEEYERLDWRARRALIHRLEKLGGAEAVPTLRRILEAEESQAVRIFAAESLARLGDPVGVKTLKLANLEERVFIRAVTVEIFMAQGLRYLREDEYEKAAAEFLKILEIAPEDELAHYNLACTYSLWGRADEAFESLRLALENGFDGFDHMEKDEDLDPIREDGRYRELLEKHAPEGK